MSEWAWVFWLLLPAAAMVFAFLVTDHREHKRKARTSGRQWLRDRAEFYRRLR